MNRILARIKLLPVLILVAFLAFAVRVGDFVTGLENLGSAHAQHEVNAEPPPLKASPDNHAADKHTETATAVPVTDHAEEASAPAQEIPGRLDLDVPQGDIKLKPSFAEEAADEAKDVAEPEEPKEKGPWKDSVDTEIDQSPVREDMYKDLAKRRELLDKKEKEIAVREALLSAAERELDQKLRELGNIRAEIEGMMKKRSEEEEARIASLVKIYEGMKPKDAASILNTLDLDVLIVIMTKMSERKSSPILAEMNPDRARTITTMMAEQRQVPSLSPEN